ncbi:MAG TPA: hypothetical protein VME24_07890, partial [Alphaproteobacteria bacterium]|nr:hypothetical protein [Alphaproteobacteria bacterium]
MINKLPSSSSFGARLVCGGLLAFCMAWLFAQAALGQTYVNNQNQYYSVPGPNPPPQFDDTGFVNKNVFSITYSNFDENNIQFVEPWWGTLYYTNTGEMMVNAPIPSNFIFIGIQLYPFYQTAGVGYEFDLQEGNSNVMAGTFNNPGTIHCNSVLDTNNIFNFDGAQFFEETSIGGCIISATNIINHGNVNVGVGGQFNLNGQNVDLSRSVLTLEQGLFGSNNVDTTVNSEGQNLLVNTNGLWNPFASLTPFEANSAPPPPDSLTLLSPSNYIQIIPETPSNNLVQAVFIVNVNTNTPASVYIAPAAIGSDGALIQWSGTFLNPATDIVNTNYLYLYHHFFTSTNFPFGVLTVGTIPDQFDEFEFGNWLWAQSSPFSPLPPPNTEGFQNVFGPDNLLTNVMYDFFNATLTGTSAGTNATTQNPSGALTNLPNRLIISANHELKMDLAQISGPNYMSINATNQFDGSPGALIATPYSDLNLAVTNGYPHPLTISNLLASSIVQWGGTLDEWGTRWTNLDANGVSWEYRVVLIYANLTPAITPQVQNLTLTASNLVISDVLDVFGSMYANAQSLTLTTNFYGSGATSPDGELNMQQPPWAWTWSGSFPNLFLLTNNGAIRMPNYADFIATTPVTNGVPTIPPVQATNILYEAAGKNVVQGNTVTIFGSPWVYTFTNTINGASPAYFVKIGPSFDASLTNLAAAINSGKGTDIVYSAYGSFHANPGATAGGLLT